MVFRSICTIFARRKRAKLLTLGHRCKHHGSRLTAALTSMEEPTDEVLSQLMREAAEEARETNAQATQRFFDELRQAAANIR